MSDTIFTIPFRYDSERRLSNLVTVVRTLHERVPNCMIMIGEQGEERAKLLAKAPSGRVEHMNIVTGTPFFWRTAILNTMAKAARRTGFKVLVNCDADVLVTTDRYLQAADLIRQGRADMVLPYDTPSMNVDPAHQLELEKELTLDPDKIDVEKCVPIQKRASLGGMIYWNPEAFVAGGMENEHFRGWGFEDNERYCRFHALGYRIKRLSGPLFHLTHPKGPDSGPDTQYVGANKREFHKVRQMNPVDLDDYIGKWTWLARGTEESDVLEGGA